MQNNTAITVVVPTLNEADNLRNLVDRIDISLNSINVPYEILIIDDHSTDGTQDVANRLTRHYPVRFQLKQGARGKASSLLQGFEAAHYPLIVMIDADLQYPPEEIVPMYQLMVKNNADIVVTRRDMTELGFIRTLSSNVFNLLFARMLFGINFDTQSGLKLFKKSILEGFDLAPSPWSFDLEFLVRSLEKGHRIMDHSFMFEERTAGATKIKLLSATIELAKAAIKLRWQSSPRKIRQGYRQNSRFIKRSVSIAVIAMLLGSSAALFSAPQSQVNALGVPTTKTQTRVTQAAQKVIDAANGVANSIQSASQQTNSSSNSSQTQTAASTSSSNPISSVTNTVTSLLPTSSSTTSTSSDSGTTTTGNTSAGTTSTSSSTNSQASSAVGSNPDSTASSATNNQAPQTDSQSATQSKVTAGKDTPIYTTPSSLKRSTHDILAFTWKAILLTSLICIISVMIIKASRKTSKVTIAHNPKETAKQIAAA